MLELFFCGDVLINNKTLLPNELKTAIGESEFAICNFEAPIRINKSKKTIKAGPNISQGENSISELKEMGFNVLTLSNNHIFDYGLDSIKNTIDIIKKHNLIPSGFYFNSKNLIPIQLKNNGVSISLISCGENTEGCLKYNHNEYGYLWTHSLELKELIIQEKKKSDFVFVSVHAGLEKVNFPLGIWHKLYRDLIDYGADVIIGHHPHIAQGIEKYKDALIFYSLGNFIFDYPKNSNESAPSLSVKFNLSKNKIDYQLYFHRKLGDKIILEKNSDSILKELNIALNEVKKNSSNVELEISMYMDSFKKYIRFYSTGLLDYSLRSILKWFYYKLLKRNEFQLKKNKLLEHLFVVDTNMFLIKKYFNKKD